MLLLAAVSLWFQIEAAEWGCTPSFSAHVRPGRTLRGTVQGTRLRFYVTGSMGCEKKDDSCGEERKNVPQGPKAE